MKEITIYVPTDPKVELPPKRKEITDYSIQVIGIFSETLVDAVHYNYHKKEWSFSDGDDYGILKMKYWMKPVTISEEGIEEICKSAVRSGAQDYSTEWSNAMKIGRKVAKAILALMKGER